MKNRVWLILLIVILLIFVIVISQKSKEDLNLKTESDNTLIESDDITRAGVTTEEQIAVDDKIKKANVSERFYDIASVLLKQKSLKNASVESSEKIKELLKLEDIKFDGLLITNSNKDDFCEIVLIDPEDKSYNDSLMVAAWNRSIYLQESNPESEIIWNSNNIIVTQEGGITILIISKDVNNIHSIINQNI